LRGHYLSIATLAIGEIVDWSSSIGKADARSIGISGIPSLSLFGFELESNQSVYWFTLGVVVILAALQFRLLSSHLGRVLRRCATMMSRRAPTAFASIATRRWPSRWAASPRA